MTTSYVVPNDVADKIQRLRRAGYGATIEPATDLCSVMIAPCRACDTNVTHPADVLVNVVLALEWTEPAESLDGWVTPCCWAGLVDCLDEIEHTERFDSVQIEVPV